MNISKHIKIQYPVFQYLKHHKYIYISFIGYKETNRQTDRQTSQIYI